MDRLIFPDLLKNGATAFFTGKYPGADPDHIAELLHISADNIFMPTQRHTDKIAVIGLSAEPVIADAVITKETGILIGVKVADCVPILLCESSRGILGAVHAGWRGTASALLKKTLGLVMDRFSCRAENIYLAVGPAIRWCCYHVDYDVMHAVERATGPGEYFVVRSGKYCLDLPNANKCQALSVGIPEGNIWLSNECTFCNPEKYYSYRFSRGTTGRQGAFIGKL